jgi:hypothetical protein
MGHIFQFSIEGLKKNVSNKQLGILINRNDTAKAFFKASLSRSLRLPAGNAAVSPAPKSANEANTLLQLKIHLLFLNHAVSNKYDSFLKHQVK